MSNSPSCGSCGRPNSPWATDRLTLLLDRWGWDAQAPQILAASRSTALVVLDLDNFKEVNDRYGHVAGDAVLRAVADTLRHSTRKGDLLGRYGGHGGDEFLIMLPETTRDEALAIAERVRQAIRAMVVQAPTDGGTVQLDGVTASFGVSAGNPSTNLQTLVVEADSALRRAKRTGRNRVRAPGRRSMRWPVAALGACAASLVVVALVSDAPRDEQIAAESARETVIRQNLPTITLPPITVPTTVTMTATVPPPSPTQPQAPPAVGHPTPTPTQTPRRPPQAPTASQAEEPSARGLERPSTVPRQQCAVCAMMDAAISDYMRFLGH